MIGTEDRIMNPWAHFAKKYGFIPLFGDGSTKYVFHITYFMDQSRILYYCSMQALNSWNFLNLLLIF